jgi:hypothetical protein
MLRDAMMRLQSVFRCFTEVAQQVPLISCLNWGFEAQWNGKPG